MHGFFVTGTHGGAGKTLVCGALALRVAQTRSALYWKPVVLADREPGAFEKLVPGCEVIDPMYSVRSADDLVHGSTPSGPIDLQGIVATLARRGRDRVVIVEGTGGVLTPLGPGNVMADLMWWLRLPVVLVVENGNDSVNHALLSLEALKARGLGVIGVVLTGVPSALDASVLERHGNVAMLGMMSLPRDTQSVELERWALDELDPRGIIEGFVR